MEYLETIHLSCLECLVFCSVILFASVVRGVSGVGFSASSVSLLSFILPPKEIVPIILLLEIIASFFMIPSIWNKINWKLFYFFFRSIVWYTVRNSSSFSVTTKLTHLIISITVLIFAFLLLRGYKNRDLNHNLSKFFVGVIAGTVNGFGTLAGLPIALYFLIIAAEPAVIRASLAALFFLLIFMLFCLHISKIF